MEKYIDLETHVRPNDSMSLMTIEEMLKKYTDGYSKEAQVELVRCRDCRYHVAIDKCCHPDGLLCAKDNNFCSYGERME